MDSVTQRLAKDMMDRFSADRVLSKTTEIKIEEDSYVSSVVVPWYLAPFKSTVLGMVRNAWRAGSSDARKGEKVTFKRPRACTNENL